MLQVAIIPGDHNGDLFSFLTPLLNELRILEDGGLKIICKDGSFNFKVHLLLASGDIIGVQELMHHKGHNSEYGCRQCRIQTIREISPAGKGYGHYYTGTINMSTARRDEELKDGAEVLNQHFFYIPYHYIRCIHSTHFLIDLPLGFWYCQKERICNVEVLSWIPGDITLGKISDV